MTDGEHIFAIWLLIMGAFVLGGLIDRKNHNRRVLPTPRRMTK
jgi:hypothetical protein